MHAVYVVCAGEGAMKVIGRADLSSHLNPKPPELLPRHVNVLVQKIRQQIHHGFTRNTNGFRLRRQRSSRRIGETWRGEKQHRVYHSITIVQSQYPSAVRIPFDKSVLIIPVIGKCEERVELRMDVESGKLERVGDGAVRRMSYLTSYMSQHKST